MQDAIDEFTLKSGKEKTDWVDISVQERIHKIGQKCGEGIQAKLHTAMLMVYRHSSEVLHGTLFGALHLFGSNELSVRPKTLKNLGEHIGQQQMMILFAAIISICEVVETFDKVYGFSAAKAEADSIMKRLDFINYLNRDGALAKPPT
jgi:hypothetical protein